MERESIQPKKQIPRLDEHDTQRCEDIIFGKLFVIKIRKKLFQIIIKVKRIYNDQNKFIHV